MGCRFPDEPSGSSGALSSGWAIVTFASVGGGLLVGRPPWCKQGGRRHLWRPLCLPGRTDSSADRRRVAITSPNAPHEGCSNPNRHRGASHHDIPQGHAAPGPPANRPTLRADRTGSNVAAPRCSRRLSHRWVRRSPARGAHPAGLLRVGEFGRAGQLVAIGCGGSPGAWRPRFTAPCFTLYALAPLPPAAG